MERSHVQNSGNMEVDMALFNRCKIDCPVSTALSRPVSRYDAHRLRCVFDYIPN